jgi:arsenite oxidase small subunit
MRLRESVRSSSSIPFLFALLGFFWREWLTRGAAFAVRLHRGNFGLGLFDLKRQKGLGTMQFSEADTRQTVPPEIPSPSGDGRNRVSRRQFTRFLTFAGIATALGAAWVYFRGWFSSPSAPREIEIGSVGEIGVGESKIFQYPRASDPCILIRPASDTYLAYSRFCTHLQCVVFYRPAQEGFECPCHHGFFSAADGSVLVGPPPRPLPRVQIEQRADKLWAVGMESS